MMVISQNALLKTAGIRVFLLTLLLTLGITLPNPCNCLIEGNPSKKDSINLAYLANLPLSLLDREDAPLP